MGEQIHISEKTEEKWKLETYSTPLIHSWKHFPFYFLVFPTGKKTKTRNKKQIEGEEEKRKKKTEGFNCTLVVLLVFLEFTTMPESNL